MTEPVFTDDPERIEAWYRLTPMGRLGKFVARLLSVVTTPRQQERDVLDYLTDACAAVVTGTPPPSLLPQAPRTILIAPLAA